MPAHDSFADAGADGAEPGVPDTSRQPAAVEVHDPTSRGIVHDWILQRVERDPAMRAAQHRNDERQEGE
jgi:hypothetical protein